MAILGVAALRHHGCHHHHHHRQKLPDPPPQVIKEPCISIPCTLGTCLSVIILSPAFCYVISTSFLSPYSCCLMMSRMWLISCMVRVEIFCSTWDKGWFLIDYWETFNGTTAVLLYESVFEVVYVKKCIVLQLIGIFRSTEIASDFKVLRFMDMC